MADAECLSCGGRFAPRKAGHVFCSIDCRHQGARRPHERARIDHAAIDRLWDPRRDADERVRADDWIAPSCASGATRGLFATDTVACRRRWFTALERTGAL